MAAMKSYIYTEPKGSPERVEVIRDGKKVEVPGRLLGRHGVVVSGQTIVLDENEAASVVNDPRFTLLESTLKAPPTPPQGNSQPKGPGKGRQQEQQQPPPPAQTGETTPAQTGEGGAKVAEGAENQGA